MGNWTNGLSPEDIEKIIPHRLPMRLVCKVRMEDHDRFIGFSRTIKEDIPDPIIDTSDKDRLLTLDIEACAQTAATAVLKDKKDMAILFESINDLELYDLSALRLGCFVSETFSVTLKEDSALITAVDNGPIFRGTITCSKPIPTKVLARFLDGTKKKAPILTDPHPSLLENHFDWFSTFPVKEISDNCVKTAFYLGENAPVFQGHFPNQPILPGVVQLLGAVKTTQEGFGKELKLSKIEEFRFLNPVVPPSILSYEISKGKDGVFEVKAKGNILDCAIGTLHFFDQLV